MVYQTNTAQEVARWNGRPGRLFLKSERLMRPVTEGPRVGLLALAQSHFLLFSQCKLDRLEAGSLMRPVTEWLVP